MNSGPKLFNAKGRIVTEILGRNKYSNYKQALNEAISNSLDAKASRVQIFLNKDYIEIIDNGKGMSEADLENRYFTLGEKNLDKSARGLFGIGVCANAALGDSLTIETRLANENSGIRAEVDFIKVEQFNAGNYDPEAWEKIDFTNKDYSTYIKVQRLRWSTIDSDEVVKFLIAKHWPLLLDESIGLSIEVNGVKIHAEEPQNVKKYEFSSEKEFKLGEKTVPLMDLDCGKVEGVFYLSEAGFEEPSLDVYVKNQRIDAYSGDQVDWLRIKDLTSTEGFRRRLKGIIKVEATDEVSLHNRSITERNILTLKSDRTGFFEESLAFKHLCAYLNEKSRGRVLNLSSGGILRLIHADWYKNRGVDITQTQELINKLEPELKDDLAKIYEEEKLKVNTGGDLQKQGREENKNSITSKSENLLFKCPKCENIIRVKIGIFKQWESSSQEEKDSLRKKFWTCNACGYILDPIRDKYKRGPIKGKEIFQVHLADGFLTHILAEPLGRDGPRAIYIPEESVIKINAEHGMLIYSVKTSDEAFKCNLLDSIVFAISARRSADNGEKFESVYNKESAKVNKVIDLGEYEDALSKLRIGLKDKN
jgi:hypothetical protein